jgi:hypothetical protein
MIGMLCSVNRRGVLKWPTTLLCANLAIGSYKPSYTELSNGCSQEVQ